MPRKPLTDRQLDQQIEDLRAKIAAGRSPFLNDTPETKKARIARALTDRTFYQQTYLPHYFSSEPASIHLEMVQADANELDVAAAPREHAKSTHDAIGLPLHRICIKDLIQDVAQQEHFIIIGSDTETQAAAFTASIKDELENNEKLKADFPEACGKIQGGETDFITSNDIRVMARGAGQKIRGLHHKQWRPTLMVWDDLENDEAVESEEQRKKLWRWFFKAVLSARGKGGRVRVRGTILHPESLLARLLDPNDHARWTKHFWQAPDPDEDGAVSLWPEVWPIERLKAKKEEIGSVFYSQEFMNVPIDEETALFKEDAFKFFDDADLVGKKLTHYGACDPSLGKTDRSDFSAIVDGLVDPEHPEIIYVDEADIDRRKPQAICAAAIEHGRRHDYVAFGFESVGFQEVLKANLEEQSDKAAVYLSVVEVSHEGVPKDLRIRRLSPLVERGVIRFRKTQTVLLNQLKTYRPTKKTQKDDGPDALEMLVRVIKEQLGGGPWIRSLAPKFEGYGYQGGRA